MSTPTLAQRTVGREVTFTPTHGDTHHGVITRANYNTYGEAVLVIHLSDNPISIGGNTILIGRDAESVVASLATAA